VGEAARAAAHRAHGVQTWVALPDGQQDVPPSFAHHPAASLPRLQRPGATVTVIAGDAYGLRSPVSVLSPTLYCAAQLGSDATLALPAEHEERAIYVVEGRIAIDGTIVEEGTMATLARAIDVDLRALTRARLMLLGGAPVGGRFVHWNFVASTRDRIEQARGDWARYGDAAARGRFGSVPGQVEFIALPAR
jgi:hypothetical protein